MNTNSEKTLKKIYARIKDDYERNYFSFHLYRYRFILEKINELSLPERARILDVGCYPLHLSDALSEMGYKVYGISSTHEPISRKNISVLNIEKDPLPFKKDFFNAVLFTEVMEHLLISPTIYFTKFKRVLKKDGIILVTTPNAGGLHKIIPLLLGRSTYFPLEQLYNTKYADGSIYHRHNREYTKKELSDVLKRAGFESEVGFANAYRSYQRGEVKNSLARRVVRIGSFLVSQAFERYKDSLYAVASKK